MKLMKVQRPAWTTWPGLSRLADLSDELDRWFESPLAGVPRALQLLGAGSLALDLHEDKENFVIQAELPGVNKEDVSVAIQDGCLSIAGERRSETKKEDTEVHHTERFFGRFQRTVTLPAAVAAE